MGDYVGHWLEMGEKAGAKLPELFWVNWFRKDDDGTFIWPGFGENSRVLKWVLARVAGDAQANETAIGFVPTPDSLDTDGLDLDRDSLEILLSVDNESWRQELPLIEGHYEFLGGRLPQRARDELAELEKRLSA
jgi:phosphoenolpyruvate carboxykinase (GTP)